MDAKQFLVSETALAELFSVIRYCWAESTPVIKFFVERHSFTHLQNVLMGMDLLGVVNHATTLGPIFSQLLLY